MDIGKSFTYMFEDANWITKLAIGGGILLLGTFFAWVLFIPMLAASALLLGYSLTVTRNVYDGNPTPLPDWTDIGALFVKGLMALVGVILWFVPVIILACCVWLASIVTGGATSNDRGAAQTFSGIAGLLISCLSCVLALLSLATSLAVYAPLTRFALSNQLSTFWDFAGAWQFVRANLSNYIILFILILVTNFVAAFGIIACFVGLFFTQFWAYLVGAHLMGQVARGASAPSNMVPA